jgi:hypothetical protein
MAGYIIYSLDWDKFQSFVNNPTRKQLLGFARNISDGLDQDDGAFEDGDPVHDWPSEPEELCHLVKERLARPDWYGDLSSVAQNIWGNAVYSFCSSTSKDAVGFRVDHDGGNWDVLEVALKHLHVDPNQISPNVALSEFGKRPYRYHRPTAAATSREKEHGDDAEDEDLEDDDYGMDWHEMQSLHTPDEVRKMLEEFRSAGPAIASSRSRQAIGDYDSLIPVLEKLVKEKRMLFVQVDT